MPCSKIFLNTLIAGILAIACTIPLTSYAQTSHISAVQAYQNVGLPLTEVFDAKQHGGHNQNWTSMQSQNGLIYVGHTSGISQFDGENWFNLSTPHLTPVRAISEWKNSLYIGTTDDLAKVYVNDSGKLIYQSLILAPTLATDFGQIWSSVANSLGVLFTAQNHTFFYDGDSVKRVDEAISSKHFVFMLDDAFYYKPRHLKHVFKLEIRQGDTEPVFTNTALEGDLPIDARVMEILKSTNNKLTVVTERHGIYQWQNQQFTLIKPAEAFASDVQLYDAILSMDGFYYISSNYDGLFVLDEKWNILRNYREQDNISMNTIFSVNEDLQGNIWLTGIPNVVKMRPAHVISEFKAGNTSTEILSLKNTPLGIFASGNGVFSLQQGSNTLASPSFVQLSDNIESSVDLIAHKGKLIKPGYGGVYELKLDANKRTIIHQNKLIEVGLGRVITATPKPNILLVSSSNGAYLMDSSKETWNIQRYAGLSEQLISLNLDANGSLWLGTDKGKVYKIDDAIAQGERSVSAVFKQEDGLGAGPVELFNINGKTIISSAGKLLEEQTLSVKTQDTSTQTKPARKGLQAASLPMLSSAWLANIDTIDRLIQTHAMGDIPERIWYRKNNQSAYFEKQSNGTWQEHSTIFEAVESGGFNDLFVTNNNILWFVRDKAQIYRVDINRAKQLPALASVNLRSVSSDNHDLKFLNLDDTLILAPSQQNLRFTYASSDSSSPEQIQYRTRIREANTSKDSAWSKWSPESYRDYVLNKFGDFVFELQAKDAWSRISSSQLQISAISPWYLSKAAYAIYIVCAFLFLFSFTYLVQRWRTASLEATNKMLENKVVLRTQEVNEKIEQLRQQQELKDRFFNNVSHEFRTPLTLTIGPLEVLIDEHKTELSEGVKHLATTALNNASKMLALVGQVLDLNRLEAGKLPLRITHNDIADLLRHTCERFESWAQQHEQKIVVKGCDEPLLLWFDIDQFEKCVANLLSNAIKYAGQTSIITVSLQHDLHQAQVIVADNGVGVSEEAKSKVFERFYQDKSSERVAAPGTGIGLALVKEIMEIHEGSAKLIEQEHSGCCFVLSLKMGCAHFSPQHIVEPIEVGFKNSKARLKLNTEPSNSSLLQASSSESSALKEQSEDITTLLVVDDNKELLNFISLRLSASYKILQANDGQEGLEIATSQLPDLIISDVNMPKMTGLELAQKLKQGEQTRTIPIILLTAKATKREIVEGFSVGADDYLTKPFDTSELIVRVNAQINARKLIRKTMQASDKPVLSHSSKFAQKLEDIIQQQLAQPSFNVEKLSEAMFMSRDTLNRKCKKQYNETPLNMIVKARMRRASHLLEQHNMSVSEVAYACGFESLAYFSNSFKKHTGKNPTQFTAQ